MKRALCQRPYIRAIFPCLLPVLFLMFFFPLGRWYQVFGSDSITSSRTEEKALAGRGVLRVGGDRAYPPYEFLDHGQPAGFNIDLLRAVAGVMGLTVEIKLGPWHRVRADLESGRIDMLAGMFYSEERARQVDFSVPYALVNPAIFVRRESNVHALSDLYGKVVIVQQGDRMHDYLRQRRITNRLIPVPEPLDGLRLLATGRHDAALLSSGEQGMYFIHTYHLTNLKTVFSDIPPQQYCFAVAKGNGALVGRLNKGLHILKSTGRFQAIHARWFGVNETFRWWRRALWAIGSMAVFIFLVLGWSWMLRRQVKLQMRERLASEARFATIFRESPVPVSITTLNEGKFLEVNEAFERASGYNRTEIIGSTPVSLGLYEEGKTRNRVLNAAREQGAAHTIEMVFRTKSGEAIVGLLSSASIDYQGQDCLLTVIKDITDYKRTVHALQESEERFRRLAENAPDIIYRMSLPDMRYEYISPAALAITGYTPEEYYADPLLLQGIIEPSWSEYLHEQGQRLLAGEAPSFYEFPLVDKQGNSRWIHQRNVLVKDAAGTPIAIEGIATDITALKQAEEALRRSENSLRFLIENSRDMMSRHAPDSTLLFITPACRHLVGYAPEEMIGCKGDDFLHPDDAPGTWEKIGAAIASGEDGYRVEHRIRRKDGTYLWIETLGHLLYDEHGHLAEIHCSVRDIEARRRAGEERLEMERRLLHAQKLESLGVLAGGIAHDFNNLLAAIIGNLDMAMMDLAPDSTILTCVEQAFRAAHRAADLTRQMLAYSGKGHFILKQIDLSALVNENTQMLRAAISKRVTLKLALEKELPVIIADPGQIQQVVMNLITNASEAIGDNPGVVTIATGARTYAIAEISHSRLEEKPPAGRFVWLDVVDTGCGMDAATQERLFDPFFTTKFLGRGLGMAAILGIVRGHKGAIMVDSRPGKGSSIRVLFPAAVREQVSLSTAEVAHRTVGTAAPSETRGTVLVVDDEDMVRQPAQRMLEYLGYSVLAARDGEEAIALLRAHAQITCVLLDLMMPRMDGVATLSELRRIRPNIKVILSSGYSEQEAIRRFHEHNPTAFIQKPYVLDSLRAMLDAVLEAPERQPHR